VPCASATTTSAVDLLTLHRMIITHHVTHTLRVRV
jgi:hypothetical protein